MWSEMCWTRWQTLTSRVHVGVALTLGPSCPAEVSCTWPSGPRAAAAPPACRQLSPAWRRLRTKHSVWAHPESRTGVKLLRKVSYSGGRLWPWCPGEPLPWCHRPAWPVWKVHKIRTLFSLDLKGFILTMWVFTRSFCCCSLHDAWMWSPCGTFGFLSASSNLLTAVWIPAILRKAHYISLHQILGKLFLDLHSYRLSLTSQTLTLHPSVFHSLLVSLECPRSSVSPCSLMLFEGLTRILEHQ